jgi:hypothetical protein
MFSTSGRWNDVTMAEQDRGARATYPNHHGRHDHLLGAAPPVGGNTRELDAIIVPTARTADTMEHAVGLAAELDCTLVALCSKRSVAAEVEEVARRQPATVLVIDATDLPSGVLPGFATTAMLGGSRFHRPTDTSQKRNLGLLLARLCGWQRVVFLDDDVTVPLPEHLGVAAGLTERYAGVGLPIDGDASGSFPDNSVVCHAYRDAGGDQGMFVGGGALAVGVESMNSFFPNTYNEDWFFLLGENTLRPVTMIGRALQRPYDPYADIRRAQFEEFGDCLAEGLFWLIEDGWSIQDADARFWRTFLRRRIDFIADVVAMVHAMAGDDAKRFRMLASLDAARERSERITPELCTRYIEAWRNDRERWRTHLDTFEQRHSASDVEKTLSSLGLTGQSRYLRS